MDLSSEEKRIIDIFIDLQKDRQKGGTTINLIDKSRKLIPDKEVANAQGDKRKNEIRYNPDFFHGILTNNNENLIRFILLHEEAHISSGKNRIQTYFLIFFGTIITFAILIVFFQLSIQLVFHDKQYEISNFVTVIIFCIVCYFIGAPAIWRHNWDVMFDDELSADKFGAECLFTFLNDPDPSITVTPYFTEEISIKEKERIARKIRKMKLLGVYPDYHPSDAERLERIRQAFPPEYTSSMK